MNKKSALHGIPLKKRYGQHFLRDQSVVDCMLEHVDLSEKTSVFEIGCGDGFLTRSILQTPIKALWVFEIDPEWSAYVKETYSDSRLHMSCENILDVDFSRFEPGPWTLLANLPYQITFPILRKLKENRQLLNEGVVMVQEEVAQKIVPKLGDATIQSIFYQYYFSWKKLIKVPPRAFVPPPKVHSRLLYFKPRYDQPAIPDEDAFWKFIRCCFRQRRRTLKNNLQQCHYEFSAVPPDLLAKRAQELSFEDFLHLANMVNLFN